MSDLVSRLGKVLSYYQNERGALLTELADVKAELAEALANDAADQESIEAVRAAAEQYRVTAEEAVAKAEELQALVDTDAVEDAALEELLVKYEADLPAEEPLIEAPVDEPAPTEEPVE